MKILWFANTPCGASEKLMPSSHIGGWLSSLEIELKRIEKIELFIGFYWENRLSPFSFNGVMYFPIYRSKTRKYIRKIKHNFQETVEISSLLSVISNVNPDVIHIHGTEDNFGLIQGHIKTPVVVSLQGILSPYSEKYFAGIPFFNAIIYESFIRKIVMNSVVNTYHRIKLDSKREKEILSISKHIIGRTDWDRRVTSIMAKGSNYYTGNETLRAIFYERIWDKKNISSPYKIVTTMSGGIYKGLETIVKTTKLLREYNVFDFNWIVIGQKETDEFPKLIKSWLKIDYSLLNIKFMGSKNENELVEILLDADVFCQVSHIENSPNSLCEAMLVGMPIIASFAGGTDSLLENKKEGILVQDGDPYSYCGALIELQSNCNQAKQCSLLARKRANERHLAKNITDKLLAIYESISEKK